MIQCLSKRNGLAIFSSAGIGLLCLLVGVAPALADQFDTVNYSATAGINFDSNVFRLPSGSDPQLAIGRPGKSDRARLVALGVDIDKKYSNQEVLFNAKVTSNKYNTFSNLDYNGTAYKAAWNWSLNSKFNGTMGADRTQTLNSFVDIRTNTRNLRTDDNRRINADWWFQSDWHLLAGLADGGSTSSATTINNLSYRVRTDELGLKYVPESGGAVTLTTRNIGGRYNNMTPDYLALVDTRYTEKQKELQVNWPLTGKSVLSGSLMRISRQYPLFSQRDYSGIQKGISYALGVTDKTHLNMSMNRSVNSWLGSSSSYYVTDTLSISPSWQMSAKTDMHMRLTRSIADYRGPVVANAIARRDVNQSLEIGCGWSPQRAVTFSASVQHARRSSNDLTYEFSDNIANLSVSGTF